MEHPLDGSSWWSETDGSRAEPIWKGPWRGPGCGKRTHAFVFTRIPSSHRLILPAWDWSWNRSRKRKINWPRLIRRGFGFVASPLAILPWSWRPRPQGHVMGRKGGQWLKWQRGVDKHYFLYVARRRRRVQTPVISPSLFASSKDRAHWDGVRCILRVCACVHLQTATRLQTCSNFPFIFLIIGIWKSKKTTRFRFIYK
jgi:hypothetical protein